MRAGLALDGRGRSLLLGFRPAAAGSHAGRPAGLPRLRGWALWSRAAISTAANSFMRTPLRAADSDGAAAAAWQDAPRASGQSDVVTLGHARAVAGRSGATPRVESGVAAVSIAMAPSGEFVVAWERRGLVEARLGRAAILGPVVRLGPVMGDRAVPKLDAAIDDSGDALVGLGRARPRARGGLGQHRLPAGRTPLRGGTAGRRLGSRVRPGSGHRGSVLGPGPGHRGVGRHGRRRLCGVRLARVGRGARGAGPAVSPGLAGFDQLQDVAGLRGRASVAWTHFDREHRPRRLPRPSVRDRRGLGRIRRRRRPSHRPPSTRSTPRSGSIRSGGSPVALWRTKTTARAFGSATRVRARAPPATDRPAVASAGHVLLRHHPDLLRQRASPTSGTRTRRSPPTCSPATCASAARTSSSSPAPTSTASRSPRPPSGEGVTPRELADSNAERFRDWSPRVNATNDFFIRTSDPEHEAAVAEVVQRIYDNGHVYEGIYEGWYCPRCADFKTETRARSTATAARST